MTKLLRRRVFGESNSKPCFFSKSKWIFVALLWPKLPCMASQRCLGDGIGRVQCIQVLAGKFLEFSKRFLAENSLKKKRLLVKTLHYLKFCTFTVQQSDAYHLNWGTDKSKVYNVGFWCNFWLRAKVSQKPIAENFQSSFPKDSSTLLQTKLLLLLYK